MEHTPFKLEAGFEPAGDQPQAIEKLVEGVNDGLAHQTLLGVTGSGKSVGYNEPLLIAESKSSEMSIRLVKAGPFIDELMQSTGLPAGDCVETERFATASRSFFTPAYEPAERHHSVVSCRGLLTPSRAAANVSLGNALRPRDRCNG